MPTTLTDEEMAKLRRGIRLLRGRMATVLAHNRRYKRERRAARAWVLAVADAWGTLRSIPASRRNPEFREAVQAMERAVLTKAPNFLFSR